MGFMKSISIGLAFIAVLAVAIASSQGDEQESLSNQLRKLSLKNDSPLIYGNAELYEKYVKTSPRPYDVVILFTSKRNCELCDEILTEFEEVATLYRDQGALYPSGTQKRDRKRAVFFLVMPVAKSTEYIFEQLKLKSAPMIVVTHPKFAHMNPEEINDIKKTEFWFITSSDGVVTSKKILDFVNAKTGRSILYRESIFNIMLVFSFLAIILSALLLLLKICKPLFAKTITWFIGAQIFFAICVSGAVSLLLNGFEPFRHRDDGSIEYISNQGDYQYAIESPIVAGLVTLIGVLLIFSVKCTAIKNRFVSWILFAVWGAIFYYSLLQFEDFFRRKMSYEPQFWPPESYVKGPLSRDQGNSL